MYKLRAKKTDPPFSNEQVGLAYEKGKTQVRSTQWAKLTGLFDSWKNTQSLSLYFRVPSGQNTDLPDGKNAGPLFKQCNSSLIHLPISWAKRRNAVKDALATLSVFNLSLRVGRQYSLTDQATVTGEKNTASFALHASPVPPPVTCKIRNDARGQNLLLGKVNHDFTHRLNFAIRQSEKGNPGQEEPP